MSCYVCDADGLDVVQASEDETRVGPRAMLDPDEALARLNKKTVPADLHASVKWFDDRPALCLLSTTGNNAHSRASSRGVSPVRSPLRSSHRIRSPIRKRYERRAFREESIYYSSLLFLKARSDV